MYWVGQKVCSGFSVLAYGKTKKNFLANPVISNSISTRPPNSKGVEASSLQTQESSPDVFLSSEKGMATHSSILAWRILWTEEPGRLPQSMGSQRVGHS